MDINEKRINSFVKKLNEMCAPCDPLTDYKVTYVQCDRLLCPKALLCRMLVADDLMVATDKLLKGDTNE